MERADSIRLDALIRHLEFWLKENPNKNPPVLIRVDGGLRPMVGDFAKCGEWFVLGDAIADKEVK